MPKGLEGMVIKLMYNIKSQKQRGTHADPQADQNQIASC